MPVKLSTKRKNQILAGFADFPFPAYLGMEIESLAYGRARFKLPYRKELTQGNNYIHGGAITALCDSAVAFALATMIDGGEKMLTIELKTNFLYPADDDIFAEAEIIHKGNNTAVGEVTVTKTDKTQVAKAIVTYFLKNNKKNRRG